MSEWTYTRLTTLPDDVKGRYSGLRDTEPENPIEGDFYVYNGDDESIRKLTIFVFYDDRWMTLAESGLTDAQKSEIAGIAQKDVLSNIKAGTVTESEYGYFNTLVADILSVGDIYIYGNIHSDALDTGDAQQAQTLVWKSTLRFITNLSTGAGETAPCVSLEDLRDTLLVEGSYYATSGTISIAYGGQTKTYTATQKDPIKVIWTSESLKIQNALGSYGTDEFTVQFFKRFNMKEADNGFFFSWNGASIETNALNLELSKGQTYVRSLVPKGDSTNHIGDENLPFDSIWVGSKAYGTIYGHCTLLNGLVLKYGKSSIMVGANQQTGSLTIDLTSSSLYGGEFPHAGLIVIASKTTASSASVGASVGKSTVTLEARVQNTSAYIQNISVHWIALGF